MYKALKCHFSNIQQQKPNDLIYLTDRMVCRPTLSAFETLIRVTRLYFGLLIFTFPKGITWFVK